MIEVAALCIGIGILYRYFSHNNKTKAQFLSRATTVKDLKGLGDLLGKKPLSRTVVVFGTVGSASPLESNRSGAVGVFLEETATIWFEKKKRNKNKKILISCKEVPWYLDDGTIYAEELVYMTVGSTSPLENNRSGAVGVFLEETATACFQRKNRKQNKKIVMSCKEVPWYLDDGTARVNVMDAMYAKGFYDTLKMYPFTEPVTKLIERFPFFVKDTQILGHKCYEHVLEIGTPLTLVGRAEREKDGAPTIGSVYKVFNGHVNVEELVSKLESDSKYYRKVSVLFTTLGVAIGVRALHISQLFQEHDDIL